MLDTSGVQVTEKEDGTIELFFADYGVEQFGGGDYECTYYFDKANSDKFRRALSENHSGTLEEMVIAAFTKTFNVSLFYAFCRERGIEFGKSTWF